MFELRDSATNDEVKRKYKAMCRFLESHGYAFDEATIAYETIK